jgi:hypothetical protein
VTASHGAATTSPATDPTVRLRDDGSVEDAVAARRARHHFAQVESELATFVGTLRELAERGVEVTIRGDDDRGFQGVVLAVATDHVVMATPPGQRVHMLLDAIHTVRVEPGSRAGIPRSSREAAQDLLLLERLDRWLDDPPDVAIFVAGRIDPVRGRLTAVGDDVLTIRDDHDEHPTWIAAGAVRCVALEA